MFEGAGRVWSACSSTLLLLFTLLCAGGAEAVVVDFENNPALPVAPDTFIEAGATQVAVVPGVAIVSGGVVLGYPAELPEIPFVSRPNVYGSANAPVFMADPSLLPTTTIDIDPAVAATLVEGVVLNLLAAPETFTVSAFGPGGLLETQVLADVPSSALSGIGTYSFSAASITRVTITPSQPGGEWAYMVDTVAINESLPFCPIVPLEGCLVASKGSLSIQEGKPGKEKLKLKLSKFDAETTQADFGTPGLIGGRYDVCLYTGAEQLVTNLIVDRVGDFCGPKEKPCWKAKGTSGYTYSDKSAESSGVKSIKTEDGKGKIQIQAGNQAGKGQTSLPTGLIAELQGSSVVTAQVNVLGASCFDVMLDVRKATPTKLKAK